MISPELEAKIADVKQKFIVAQQQKQHQREARENAAREAVSRTFTAKLRCEFSDSILEQLQIETKVRTRLNELKAYAEFPLKDELGTTWAIELYANSADNWNVRFPSLERMLPGERERDWTSKCLLDMFEVENATPEELLLLFVGGWEETVEQLRQDRAKVERKRLAEEAQRERIERERQQQREIDAQNRRIEIAAEAKVVHEVNAEIVAQVESRTEAARRELDRLLEGWQPGVELKLYKIIWCCGSFTIDDECNPQFDYDSLWTADPQPDVDGFYCGYISTALSDPDYRRNYIVKPYSVRLRDYHLPTVERYTCRSFEELPLALRQKVVLEITGIRDYIPDPEVQLHLGLTDDELPFYRHVEDSNHYITIGERPVDWVMQLLQ